jgi:hypothetical protein
LSKNKATRQEGKAYLEKALAIYQKTFGPESEKAKRVKKLLAEIGNNP